MHSTFSKCLRAANLYEPHYLQFCALVLLLRCHLISLTSDESLRSWTASALYCLISTTDVYQDAGVEIYLGAGIRFEQNSHDSNNRLSGVSLGAGKSSKVGLPGGDDIGGLSGDDGTVGVGDQAVVDVGVGHGSHRVDSTSGSSVGSPGGDNIRGVGGDDGTVGVADKRSSSVDNRSMGNTGNGVDDTSGVVEGGLGSGHGGGVGGNHGAVGVTHQLGRGESHAGREDLRKMMLKKKLGYFAIFIREMFHDPFIKKEDYFDFSSHP